MAKAAKKAKKATVKKAKRASKAKRQPPARRAGAELSRTAARIHAIRLLEAADSVHETAQERQDIFDCLKKALDQVPISIAGEADRISWGLLTEQDCKDINQVLFGCLTAKGYSPVPITPVLLRLREKDAVLAVSELIDWLAKVVD